MQLVEVHKEIHVQQTNILKAFYVDLLLPLESNLEKDTKVVASEHKRFLHQHKSHHDNYQKALALSKKQKKRNTRSILAKDVKQLHALEDEKKKLDEFCEESLKQAITQERRRYGFVLERQCSLTKHYLAYHTKGQSVLQHNLDQWLEIVKTREYLPESIEKMFDGGNVCKTGSMEYAISSVFVCHNTSCTNSPVMGMRKTQSIDSSYLDLRDYQDAPYPRPLSRAKSDFNLTCSSSSLVSSDYSSSLHTKTITSSSSTSSKYHVRALYSYLSSGEHQLSFHEGDIIVLIGDRNKGWQYGENLRNHRIGWFPIAYTEPILDNSESEDQSSSSPDPSNAESRNHTGSPFSRTFKRPFSSYVLSSHDGPYSTFIDKESTLIKSSPVTRTPLHETKHPNPTTYACIKFHHPPLVEAPQIFRSPRRSLTAPFPISVPPPNLPSLHSSNDSGFCNESGQTISPTPTQEDTKVVSEKKDRDNIFASVKLRKVITNDRSAPMIA